jgi:hypothetical protein
MCINGKYTGKRDFKLQNLLFLQNMCRNLKFLTGEKKLIEEKPNICAIGPDQ